MIIKNEALASFFIDVTLVAEQQSPIDTVVTTTILCASTSKIDMVWIHDVATMARAI